MYIQYMYIYIYIIMIITITIIIYIYITQTGSSGQEMEGKEGRPQWTTKEISARNHCIWYFRKWRRVQLVRGNVSIRVGLCEEMWGQH